MKTSFTCLLLLLAACDAKPAIRVEPGVPSASDTATTSVLSPSVSGPKKLPILGDPLGLLSKPPEPVVIDELSTERRAPDPGALSTARATRPSDVREPQRDPRAVARARATPRPMPTASSEIRDVTPVAFVDELRRSNAKLRVLYLYAAYCPACRDVLPNVRAAAKRFYGQGVEFHAGSVDRDRDAYAAYVPSLDGVLPATLVSSDGTMASELKRLGVPLAGKGFSIPLVAVFDRKDRLVAYGNSTLAARLEQSLEPLIEK